MKSILEYFLSPLALIFVFFIVGISLLFAKKYWKFDRALASAGLFILFIFSLGLLKDLFLHSLEYQYPPISKEMIAKIEKILLRSDRGSEIQVSPFKARLAEYRRGGFEKQ